MCRQIRRIDFLKLFQRDIRKYDIAELPRLLAYIINDKASYNILKNPSATKIRLSIPRRRSRQRPRDVFKLTLRIFDSDENKSLKINCINVKLDYIRNYVKCLIRSIKENANIFSKCDLDIQYPIIETCISEEALNYLLKKEYAFRLRFCGNEIPGTSSEISINELISLRTSSIKGILRYALFKLIVLYSLHDLIEIRNINSIRKVLRLLIVFSYILTHDDDSLLFTEKNIYPLRGVIREGIPLLHSIIFGSGTNRSILSLGYIETKHSNLIRYYIRISSNSLFSTMVLRRLLSSFIRRYPYSNDITLEKLLYSIFCMITGSLNYICYLDGPFVPVLPGYSIIRRYISKIITSIYIPKELDVNDVNSIVDDFLKFYVHSYILERINLEA